jgi:sugar lactone lactonase YvrE
MRAFTILTIGVFLAVTPAQGQSAKVSILVDLDPARVDRSVRIESIAADAEGRLYVADTLTGNVFRVDPGSPTPVVVGRIPARDTRTAPAGTRGLAFNAQGDLFIANSTYSEVRRIRKEDLRPERPGIAQTFATGTVGANGLAFDKQGNLFVTGTETGRIYRVGAAGGAAQIGAQLELFLRTLPDGRTVPAPGPNGIAVDPNGVLYVTSTGPGEIWKIETRPDGSVGKPILFIKSPLIERVDGIAFDKSGTAWLALQRNALVIVTPGGELREVAKTGSSGPLETPTAIVFVGSRAYVNNFDTPPPPNGDGKTSTDGIGASIAQIDP